MSAPAADPKPQNDLIIWSARNGVTTLTMNLPKRLNGWTMPMMEALKAALARAEQDEASRAVVLTGADPYYCAGVNLSATIQLGHPRDLHAAIVEHNAALFESFLGFTKPILVAANGPGIGASVTSATLCDGIIASDKATFSTPFAALGVTPEGCSSVLFARLMGEESAQRMLGKEGWKPTGEEALAVGLVEWCVPHDTLLDEAQRIAEGWIAEGRTRTFRGGLSLETLREANARESIGVADSFLGGAFLKGQFRFLWKKKKRGPAMMFLSLWLSRPLWGLMLPRNEQP